MAVLDTGVAFRAATITATIPAFRDGPRVYQALGRVTMPYSAARQVVSVANPDRIVAPRDFIWNNADPLDFDGHGTHVSGTIGQLTNDATGTAGVAFNVKLMPVKVIDSQWDFLFGAPNEGTDEVVARGIRYAADNGAKVINMSIGRDGPPAPAVEDAIKYAVGKGVFIAIDPATVSRMAPRRGFAEIASRVKGAVSSRPSTARRTTPTTQPRARTSRSRRPAGTNVASAATASCSSRHSTSLSPTRIFSSRRSIARRDSTSSVTSATSERRWPRRMLRASPRC